MKNLDLKIKLWIFFLIVVGIVIVNVEPLKANPNSSFRKLRESPLYNNFKNKEVENWNSFMENVEALSELLTEDSSEETTKKVVKNIIRKFYQVFSYKNLEVKKVARPDSKLAKVKDKIYIDEKFYLSFKEIFNLLGEKNKLKIVRKQLDDFLDFKEQKSKVLKTRYRANTLLVSMLIPQLKDESERFLFAMDVINKLPSNYINVDETSEILNLLIKSQDPGYQSVAFLHALKNVSSNKKLDNRIKYRLLGILTELHEFTRNEIAVNVSEKISKSNIKDVAPESILSFLSNLKNFRKKDRDLHNIYNFNTELSLLLIGKTITSIDEQKLSQKDYPIRAKSRDELIDIVKRKLSSPNKSVRKAAFLAVKNISALSERKNVIEELLTDVSDRIVDSEVSIRKTILSIIDSNIDSLEQETINYIVEDLYENIVTIKNKITKVEYNQLVSIRQKVKDKQLQSRLKEILGQ